MANEKEFAPVSQEESVPRPVYLVYGIAYQNVEWLMRSLQEVQLALLDDGVPSFITEKDAFASIEENARVMKREVLNYLAEHPNYMQVDIIAHSKGGLEARYMISRLDMADTCSKSDYSLNTSPRNTGRRVYNRRCGRGRATNSNNRCRCGRNPVGRQ
ncbi:MAG: hypothetical protein U5P10_11405 [Spirochaetia bacterium]|nr:hypothetical protein [Spirochaetia bacterium]